MAEQYVTTPLTSGAASFSGADQSEGSPRAFSARIAQLVEQRIENPRVGGSNPPSGTIFTSKSAITSLVSATFRVHVVCHLRIVS